MYRYLLFFLYFLISKISYGDIAYEGRSIFSTESPSYSVPTIEIDALNEIYITTNGENWFWRNQSFGKKWNFTDSIVNPCTQMWQGITCSCNQTCNIVELNLASYGLTGPYATSIGNLSQLVVLNMSNNFLEGEIPKNSSFPTKLREIDLSFNFFLSEIPTKL
jgi:hypothetical protein